MKKLIVFVLLLSTQFISAQEPAADDNNIYNTGAIEVKPEYPGGMQKLYEFFGANFKIPEAIDKNFKGSLYLSFVIEKDGSLSSIKVIRDIGYDAGKEAIRVVKMFPKWNPGMHNGKKVRTMFSLPFFIRGDNTTVPEKK